MTEEQSPKRTPGIRGPKPSGIPRAEGLRKYAKDYRQSQEKGGKSELKTWVTPDTKKQLADLKIEFNVKSVGEVIDALVQQAKINAK